jgi:hypothetical protein
VPNITTCFRKLPAGLTSRLPDDPNSSPYACPYMKEKGNSFFAPVLGRADLNVLRQLYMQSRALHLLAQHELHARRGRPYEWVVWSRLEYHWLMPHLPLHRLARQPSTLHGGKCSLWAPFGEECVCQGANSDPLHFATPC